MVVELAHITTTEIKNEKEDMVSYRETSLEASGNIIALEAPSGCLPDAIRLDCYVVNVAQVHGTFCGNENVNSRTLL
jgi:hypothetical protein